MSQNKFQAFQGFQGAVGTLPQNIYTNTQPLFNITVPGHSPGYGQIVCIVSSVRYNNDNKT